ncbi:MAG: CsbD family protein [Chitinophagales bacterium]
MDLQLKGKWNQIKGKLKEKYANLTDDDLTYAEGQDDQMWGRLQEKTGRKIEDIKRDVMGWLDSKTDDAEDKA